MGFAVLDENYLIFIKRKNFIFCNIEFDISTFSKEKKYSKFFLIFFFLPCIYNVKQNFSFFFNSEYQNKKIIFIFEDISFNSFFIFDFEKKTTEIYIFSFFFLRISQILNLFF